MMFYMYTIKSSNFIFDIQMNSIWEESIIGFLIFILYEDAIEQKKNSMHLLSYIIY